MTEKISVTIHKLSTRTMLIHNYECFHQQVEENVIKLYDLYFSIYPDHVFLLSYAINQFYINHYQMNKTGSYKHIEDNFSIIFRTFND